MPMGNPSSKYLTKLGALTKLRKSSQNQVRLLWISSRGVRTRFCHEPNFVLGQKVLQQEESDSASDRFYPLYFDWILLALVHTPEPSVETLDVLFAYVVCFIGSVLVLDL